MKRKPGTARRAARRWGGVLCRAALLLAAGAATAHAQSVTLDLGTNGTGTTARLVELTAFITLLSLAPSLLVMVSAFTRIVIVLSLLRSALGTTALPPNTVVIGLALFLTYFVMQPVLEQSWQQGIAPMMAGEIGELDGLARAAEPFRAFMTANARPDDLSLFANLAHLPKSPQGAASPPPWHILIPAFMISELRRAFEMGFLLFLPFLIIDIVVSSVLMSLGMMMVPPASIALPFKLIFFVLVDGWRLVAGSLVQSFPLPHP